MTANYESQLSVMGTELSTARNEAMARQVDVERLQEMLNHYVKKKKEIERNINKIKKY